MSANDTLPGFLIRKAQQAPDQVAIILIDATQSEQLLTYGQLVDRASAAARTYLRTGLRRGDLISVMPSDLASIIGWFWGALLIGAIPSVAPAPTDLRDPSYHLVKMRSRVEQFGIRAMITDPDQQQTVAEILGDLPCQVIAATSVDDSDLVDVALPHAPDDLKQIAFVQFTSGTTGEPRGIEITQRAVVDFSEAFAARHGLTNEDTVVTWLPLYHDMGLVGTMIAPLLAGVPIVMMSHRQWIASPTMLFDALHTYRGTMTIMPNFAFVHSARHITEEDLARLDLSHVKRVINGAERVNHESHVQFFERFAPTGLTEKSLMAGYGMAENVLTLSLSRHGDPPPVEWIDWQLLESTGEAVPVSQMVPAAHPVVSCGRVFPDTELYIINEAGEPLLERQVGEIIFRSPWLFDGHYLGDPPGTNVLRDGFFHTGDLAYMANGELYVIGRKNDLIIIGGRNIHPAHIEDIANEVEGVRRGRCVAFAVPDPLLGTDACVLVTEVRGAHSGEDRAALVRAIRQRVAGEVGVTLADVHIVSNGWIVKTTSGKLARAANREKYLMETVGLPQPAPLVEGSLEERITRIWEDVLGIAPIGLHEKFFDLGGTSMAAVNLFTRVEREFGRRLPIAALLEASTVAEFAAIVQSDEEITGRSVLVPLQPNGSKSPFFLVHPRGGHVFPFVPLLRYLPPDQPVYGLQALGLDGKAEPHRTVGEMAASYVAAIREFQPEGPYYLSGFSFGGQIAFEMARLLEQQDETVALLVIIDSRAVSARHRAEAGRLVKSPRKNLAFSVRIAQAMQRDSSALRATPVRQKLAYIYQRAAQVWRFHVQKRIGRFPEQPAIEEKSRLSAEALVLQASHHADAHYTPGPYQGEVTYISSETGRSHEAPASWQLWALGGLREVPLPGKHRDMLREPYVQHLGNALTQLLTATQIYHNVLR